MDLSRMCALPLVSLVALCLVFLPAQLAMKLERDWITLPSTDAGLGIDMNVDEDGQSMYRILNKFGNEVYIGGNETLIKLSLQGIEVVKIEVVLGGLKKPIALGPDRSKVKVIIDNGNLVSTITQEILKQKLVTNEPTSLAVTCALQNPTDNETVCWNFIRVAEMTSFGELFVCGTNAFTPLCYRCPGDLSKRNCTEINGSTLALVPKSPSTNPSTMIIDGKLYAGSVSDEDTFQRYSVQDLSTTNPVTLELETVTAGEGFIKAPTFVGKPYEYTSDDGNEYVFVFYRETALEYDNHGKKEYSRIARVCKSDPGGRVDTSKFVTFVKARLNCSIPDDLFPYYFDDIQDVVWDERNNEAYAVFTSQKSAPAASALCRFRMEDIMKLFDEGDSKQQEESNSLWLPKRVDSPRPGTCTANYDTIDYPPLLDKLVPNYNPLEPPPGELQESPPANFNASNIPTLYVDEVRFTSLVVDFDYGCVYFFGTTSGSVMKAYREDCDNKDEPFKAVEITQLGTTDDITGLELLTDDSVKYLVITTENSYLWWPLNTMCTARNEQECQFVRSPYCTWKNDTCVCANSSTKCKPVDTDDLILVQPVATNITSCDNSDVYLYCEVDCGQYSEDCSASPTWAKVDNATFVNSNNHLVKTVKLTDKLLELRVTVNGDSKGKYMCEATVDGKPYMKLVDVIEQSCLTQDSLQERCDEYSQLQKNQPKIENGQCSVDVDECDSCPLGYVSPGTTASP